VRQRAVLWPATVLTAIAIQAQPAQAGFQVCNQFVRHISVAFGFVDRERGWVARGWANVDPGQCKSLHRADLDNRYYYLLIRARGGGVWGGDVPFCIKHEKFTLVQAQYGKNTPDDCAKAGLESAQFFKVDVGQEKDHTYTVTASNNPGGGAPGEQPRRPPVAPAPGQRYPQAPQTYPQQPPSEQAPQPYRPPVATAPPRQPPYQQMPQRQPYQQVPQAQPYPQQPPQPYRPPVATRPAQQPPYREAPQPYPYQEQPAQEQPTYQQPSQPQTYQQPPGPPAGAPSGGAACQRYPNLC
jgi:uncharacterized membrane protein